VAAQKEAQAIALTEATGGEPATSPEMVIFQATMLELDARIEELTGEIERIEAELESIQAMISASSANGIQLSALERDYEILQGRYNGAVQNLNEARISERIEVTAQGQRITVIENANVPRLPSGPSPFRVVALACAAGIALAGGFFFLLEILNRTIRRPAELQSKFDIVPIATIPYMESRGRRMARRLSLVTGSLVVLIGVPAALWYIDTNYMPLDLVVQKVLERLGLV
ncbi:MAG: chain length-determining protein, partial [Pseudomonadota bacterium]